MTIQVPIGIITGSYYENELGKYFMMSYDNFDVFVWVAPSGSGKTVLVKNFIMQLQHYAPFEIRTCVIDPINSYDYYPNGFLINSKLRNKWMLCFKNTVVLQDFAIPISLFTDKRIWYGLGYSPRATDWLAKFISMKSLHNDDPSIIKELIRFAPTDDKPGWYSKKAQMQMPSTIEKANTKLKEKGINYEYTFEDTIDIQTKNKNMLDLFIKHEKLFWFPGCGRKKVISFGKILLEHNLIIKFPRELAKLYGGVILHDINNHLERLKHLKPLIHISEIDLIVPHANMNFGDRNYATEIMIDMLNKHIRRNNAHLSGDTQNSALMDELVYQSSEKRTVGKVSERGKDFSDVEKWNLQLDRDSNVREFVYIDRSGRTVKFRPLESHSVP